MITQYDYTIMQTFRGSKIACLDFHFPRLLFFLRAMKLSFAFKINIYKICKPLCKNWGVGGLYTASQLFNY